MTSVGSPRRPAWIGPTPTGDELASIARHPEHGAALIEEIAFLRDSVEAIRHHHERYDGRGYPDGLAGTTIPLFARIIAVADAFDSLTSDRPGRAALTVEQACAQLRERAGTQLDPMVVSALERVLERHTWTPHEAAFESMPGPVLKRRVRPRRPGGLRPDGRGTRACGSCPGAGAMSRQRPSVPMDRLADLVVVLAVGIAGYAVVRGGLLRPVREDSLVIALAFAVVIAVGEYYRFHIEGTREQAPMSLAAGLGFAMTSLCGSWSLIGYGAATILGVTAVAMVLGAMPHLIRGRAIRADGVAARFLGVAVTGGPLP